LGSAFYFVVGFAEGIDVHSGNFVGFHFHLAAISLGVVIACPDFES
jgi:hypothetical protein